MMKEKLGPSTSNITFDIKGDRWPSPEEISKTMVHNIVINLKRYTTISGRDYDELSVFPNLKAYIHAYKAHSENTESYHYRYMNEAISEAYVGIEKNEGGPFGCVIVKDGSVIGRGHNKVLVTNDPTMHGEISAIREACTSLKTPHLDGAVLYTTSYPCPMCLAAMMWAHIDKFYYGCTIEEAAKIGFDDSEFYDRLESSKDGEIKNYQVMHLECQQLFKYYQKLDRQRY